MRIRGLQPEDRAGLLALLQRIDAFDSEDVAIAMELIDDRLARGAASDYEFLIAEEAGELAGYACFGPIPLTAGRFDLYWIVVSPARRRRGAGAALLRAVERRVREQGGARVYVDTSSAPAYAAARAFYEAQGYRVAARLADFYRDGEDKVVYVRRLDAPA